MTERRALLLAAIAGVLATGLAYVWLDGKARALDELGTPGPVVVAARAIPAGERLDRTCLAVRQIPKAFIQPGALQEIKEADGLLAVAPCAAGEQVLANKLTASGVALALAVPPGKRAVTVAVDAAAGVAGLLKPGDLVDVFVTVEEGGAPRTTALIQAAPVLAVGRVFTAGPPSAQSADAVFGPPSADSVTLAASPYEAAQLTHLEQVGRIKLALRGPGDRDRLPLPAITGRALKPAAAGEDEPVRRR